ncbi:MAG: hypothetical protein WA659_01305 [Candidatus Aquirickettsiella sp.]
MLAKVLEDYVQAVENLAAKKLKPKNLGSGFFHRLPESITSEDSKQNTLSFNP